jgi:hypothetical protein
MTRHPWLCRCPLTPGADLQLSDAQLRSGDHIGARVSTAISTRRLGERQGPAEHLVHEESRRPGMHERLHLAAGDGSGSVTIRLRVNTRSDRPAS